MPSMIYNIRSMYNYNNIIIIHMINHIDYHNYDKLYLEGSPNKIHYIQ